MGLFCGFQLEQRVVHNEHSPIKTPELTKEAESHESYLNLVILNGKLSPYEKMLHVESRLLSEWGFRDWKSYLDSPLISHMDAALKLKKEYDLVVGIKNAGIPYAKIFEMAGLPVVEIDYSHHKRNMDSPTIDESQLQLIQNSKVLLIDIDMVTGKTLRKVQEYLIKNGADVRGAYLGLSQWKGIKSEEFGISEDTVKFKTFWKGKKTGLTELRIKTPYKRKLIPETLNLYSSNPCLPENEKFGSAAARRIARYLLGQN